MSDKLLLIAIVVTPLLGAAGILFLRRNNNRREAVSLFAAAILFALVLTLLPAIANGHRPTVQLFEFLPGIGFSFHAEPLGVAFALVVSFLWFITVMYSIGIMNNIRHGSTCFSQLQ